MMTLKFPVWGLALAAGVCLAGAAVSALAQPPEPEITLAAPFVDPTAPLAPGVSVRMAVAGEPQLSDTLTVQPEGLIQVPLAGLVRAEGLRTDQLAQEIQRRLSAQVWSNRDPITGVVTVSVVQPGISLTNAELDPDRGPRAIRRAVFAGDAAAVRQAGGTAQDELEAMVRKATAENNAPALAALRRLGEAADGAVLVQTGFGAVDPSRPGNGSGNALMLMRGDTACGMIFTDLRQWDDIGVCG